MAIKYLPLERIRLELFHNRANAAKIQKNYAIEHEIFGDELEKRLVKKLGQNLQDPGQASWSNNDVFEMAVKAIGSNSRPWAVFLTTYETLRHELLNFDVVKVAEFLSQNEAGFERRLKPFLPGLTSGKDATAILSFAKHLAAIPAAYYNGLRTAYQFFQKELSESISFEPCAATTACVALLIANRQYETLSKSKIGIVYKIRGMGIPLASEFLRNLGWTGFKPDRHILEMLDKWYSEPEQRDLIKSDVDAICRVFGQIDSSDLRLLRTSLLGAKTTPPGTSINQADQLVWLYRSTLGRSSAT